MPHHWACSRAPPNQPLCPITGQPSNKWLWWITPPADSKILPEHLPQMTRLCLTTTRLLYKCWSDGLSLCQCDTPSASPTPSVCPSHAATRNLLLQLVHLQRCYSLFHNKKKEAMPEVGDGTNPMVVSDASTCSGSDSTLVMMS